MAPAHRRHGLPRRARADPRPPARRPHRRHRHVARRATRSRPPRRTSRSTSCCARSPRSTPTACLTGETDGPVLWGPNKAAAVRACAERRGIDLERSFAYGNGDEDEELLRCVGPPGRAEPARRPGEDRRDRRLAERRARPGRRRLRPRPRAAHRRRAVGARRVRRARRRRPPAQPRQADGRERRHRGRPDASRSASPASTSTSRARSTCGRTAPPSSSSTTRAASTCS